MTVTEDDALLPIFAHQGIIWVDDINYRVSQMWIALQQVCQEILAHKIRLKHFGCMPGSGEFFSTFDMLNIVDILRLTGILPDMMIVIARNIDDVFIEQSLAISGKHQFNEPLKDHRRLVHIC